MLLCGDMMSFCVYGRCCATCLWRDRLNLQVRSDIGVGAVFSQAETPLVTALPGLKCF